MTGELHATVLGESILDIVITEEQQAERAGGSSLNVAVGLARLGSEVTFVTQIGHDREGSLITSHLAGSRVRLAPGSIGDAPTSIARATIDERGDAQYDFAFRWNPVVQLPPAISGSLHLGAVASLGTAADDSPFLTELAALRRRSVISYDPNIRPALTGEGPSAARAVERIVALCDLVKISTEDIRMLFGSIDPASVAAAWTLLGVALVVVTDGSRGARAFTRESEVDVDASRVETVADTIGAGDAFMSGLLWAMGSRNLLRREALHQIRREELARCLRIAATSAALTVEQRGANPPTLDALTQRLRRDDAIDHARRHFRGLTDSE